MAYGDDGMRRVGSGYGNMPGRISFSKTEVLHITLAVAVLTAAFSIVIWKMLEREGFILDMDPTMNIILIIGTAFILVLFSFLAHEFGHKFVAQRYNTWSEFRAYPYGLIMALILSLVFWFLFAAPGAVYIQGDLTKEMNGKISLAGPAVNFVISAVAIVILLTLDIRGTIAFAIYLIAHLNVFLGLFNMVPVLPFDGSKIVAWSIPVYIMAVAVGVVELITVFFVL